MYKLMIFLPGPEGLPDDWHLFLHQVESLSGLRREATSHVLQHLFGETEVVMVHELFFDDLSSLEQALVSPQGSEAARILHIITKGKVTLLIAEHKEDAIENIHKFRNPETTADARD